MKKTFSVMIVDDNINFVKRMRGLLEELINISSINVAGDYDEAIRQINEQKPDYVLLDINLPGKNGIEILREIKQNSWQCEVIMITNHADDYYRNQCLELGAMHFLDKSSEFGMVTEIISRQGLN